MPNYTTIELMKQRLDAAVLAGLADDLNTPPELAAPQTLAVLEQAIADGAHVIDSILGARLELAPYAADPDPQQSSALERLNCTLAIYFLYQRRCLDDSLNPLGAARELAERHLRAVARGAEQLGGTLDGVPQRAAWSSTEQRLPALRAASLERF
jgi:phage gp36-like protein